MPEKLLSIKEVAEHLKLSEEEVKRLVDIGEIPAYKIGGSFLRFRREQIEAIKNEVSSFEKVAPEHAETTLDRKGNPTHPYTELEKDIKRKIPQVNQYDYTTRERVRDFFYFNDFYLICFLLIAFLMYLILKA